MNLSQPMLRTVANYRPTVSFLLQDSIRNQAVESSGDGRAAHIELRRKAGASENRPARQITLHDPKKNLAVDFVDG